MEVHWAFTQQVCAIDSLDLTRVKARLWPGTYNASYLEIILPERRPDTPVRAINGHCLNCGYRLAWLLFVGKRPTGYSFRNVQPY